MQNMNTNNVMNKGSKQKDPKQIKIIVLWFFLLCVDAFFLFCAIQIWTPDLWDKPIFNSEDLIDSIAYWIITRATIVSFVPSVKNKELVKKYKLILWSFLSMLLPEVFLWFFRHNYALAMDELKKNPEFVFKTKVSSKGTIKQKQKEASEFPYQVQKYNTVDDKLNKLESLKQRGLVNDTDYAQLKSDIIEFTKE